MTSGTPEQFSVRVKMLVNTNDKGEVAKAVSQTSSVTWNLELRLKLDLLEKRFVPKDPNTTILVLAH